MKKKTLFKVLLSIMRYLNGFYLKKLPIPEVETNLVFVQKMMIVLLSFILGKKANTVKDLRLKTAKCIGPNRALVLGTGMHHWRF